MLDMRRHELAGLVGPSAASRALGISVSRVRQLVAEGRLPYTMTPLGKLFRPEDLDTLKRERAGRTEAAP